MEERRFPRSGDLFLPEASVKPRTPRICLCEPNVCPRGPSERVSQEQDLKLAFTQLVLETFSVLVLARARTDPCQSWSVACEHAAELVEHIFGSVRTDSQVGSAATWAFLCFALLLASSDCSLRQPEVIS